MIDRGRAPRLVPMGSFVGGLGRSRSAPITLPDLPLPGAPDDSPCQTADALEWQADLACKEQGLVITGAVLRDACGDGRYRAVEPECGEPPPPEDPGCVPGTLGDGATCIDPSLLQGQAFAFCAKASLVLSSFDTSGAGCSGGGVRGATYTCCPSAPAPAPDPSGPVCFTAGDGDGTTCQADAVLEQQAAAVCAEKSAKLADFWTDGSCPSGQARKASFTCCTGVEMGP